MRTILPVLLVIWFVIGTVAAAQRHYFAGGTNCANAGTIAVTILAGPLNYVGVNPKISSCKIPQPSK